MEAALEGTLSPNRLPFTLHNAKWRSSRGMEKRTVILSHSKQWGHGNMVKVKRETNKRREESRMSRAILDIKHATSLGSQILPPIMNGTLLWPGADQVQSGRVESQGQGPPPGPRTQSDCPGFERQAHPQAPHVARTGQDSQKKTETSERAVNATNRRANRLPPLRPLDDGFFSTR